MPRSTTALAGALAALAALAALTPAPDAAAQDAPAQPTPESSVLRVNATSQRHNFRLPWQKLSPSSGSSLGALLGGNRVLVTAELVSDATYVEIERPATGEKVTAEVDGVDYEANLALVAPSGDPGDFFEGMVPLEVAPHAAIGDRLHVWQFERNGAAVSTAVTLDDYDMAGYFLESSYFLVYEASGTLEYRDGSYALPVVNDAGQLAGLHTDYRNSENLSVIIPGVIIQHFLDDIADPPYRGFPNFGIKFSQTLDTQLREYADLEEGNGGVFVASVLPGTSAEAAGLQEGDIILELGGHTVDARGNYEDPDYGILSIAHLVKGAAQTGDTVPVKLRRDGEEITLDVDLKRKDPEDYFVPPYMFDRGPRYLIMGGLLFQELTQPYLESAGDKWRTVAPFKLVYANANQDEFEKDGREKLVFLAGTLPSPSTLGYERLGASIVEKVNGKQINNIHDLDAAFAEVPENGVHEIEFDDYPGRIYLDHEAATRDNAEILPARYRIYQLKRLD